jgi:hypothetical protein
MSSSTTSVWAYRIAAPIAIILLALALVFNNAAHSNQAAAQDKPPAKTDATMIVSDLDDIERLRALNPLKLQPEQLDKLIAALKTAQTDYDKKVNAIGASVFGPAGSEVREVKKQTLAGNAIPKEFDEKMKKLQADFLKQRDDLNTANIVGVSAAVKAILTDKQVAAATKLERDQWDKDHPGGKGATDAQLFNLYCLDMFISGARTVPLLEEVRAAAK